MSKKINFEKSLNNLEKLVDAIESQELPIDKAIKEYDKAMTILKECRDYLDEAEIKITKLEKDKAGILEKKDFD